MDNVFAYTWSRCHRDTNKDSENADLSALPKSLILIKLVSGEADSLFLSFGNALKNDHIEGVPRSSKELWEVLLDILIMERKLYLFERSEKSLKYLRALRVSES